MMLAPIIPSHAPGTFISGKPRPLRIGPACHTIGKTLCGLISKHSRQCVVALKREMHVLIKHFFPAYTIPTLFCQVVGGVHESDSLFLAVHHCVTDDFV